jgi:hypothetical protein
MKIRQEILELLHTDQKTFVAKPEKGKEIPVPERNFIIPEIWLLLALLLCS